MIKYDYKDYNDFEQFFIGEIHGAFSRFDMQAIKSGIDRLKPGDIYVEVGVQHGRSTYVAACMMPDGVEMFSVDIFDPPGGPDSLSRADFWKKVGLDKRVTYTSVGSKKAAEAWDGREISMMFIDGDHSYEGVKADVDQWSPFVKSGGYIYFHDADDTSPGVEQLVREMGASKEWDELTFYKQTQENNTSMASVRKK